MNITLIKHRIQSIRERNVDRRHMMKRIVGRRVLIKKRKRLALLQRKELAGYRRIPGANFLSMPTWLLRIYRTIITGLVSLTVGTISLASASAAKAKTAVVQKEKKPKGSASKMSTTSSQASVTVMARPVAMRIGADGEEPEIDAEARYTRIDGADGVVTYNFK